MRKPRSPRRAEPTEGGASILSRSPRATLIFLGVVGLLLWGRLLLKEVPQTASADDPAAAVEPGPSGSAAAPERIPSRPGKVGP